MAIAPGALPAGAGSKVRSRIGATLGRWFGASDSNLNLVFPNLPNFSNNLGFMKA